MNDFKNIETTVKVILRNDKFSREDDFYLYGKVIEKICPEKSNIVVKDFFLNKHSNVPAFETVTRCRRKLQSEFLELQSTKRVTNARKEKQERAKQYALEFGN